jgi:hypothetical protein
VSRVNLQLFQKNSFEKQKKGEIIVTDKIINEILEN